MIRRSGYRFADKIMRLSKLARARTQNRCPLLLVARLRRNAALTSAPTHAVSREPTPRLEGEGHVLYRRPVPVGAVHHAVDHQALLLAGRHHGAACRAVGPSGGSRHLL